MEFVLERIDAAISLVVVFPTEPVIAITSPVIFFREIFAITCSALSVSSTLTEVC